MVATRKILVLVIAVEIAACRSAPPSPSPALLGALAAVERGVNEGQAQPVAAACRVLSAQLEELRAAQGASSQRQADLQVVSAEVTAFGRSGMLGPQAVEIWKGLSARVSQVVKGGALGPESRLRFDTPPELRAAIAKVDRAFADGKLDLACNEIDRAGFFLGQWRWGQSRAELATPLEQIAVMPETCRTAGIKAAQGQWQTAIAGLAPDAK